MTTKEKIVSRYKDLSPKEKIDFRKKVANKTNKSHSAMVNWWFSPSKDFAIPAEQQKTVLDLFEEKETVS